ncbi:MAG: EAL domain-containing protein [Xanthomonadales bacterium]|nr:EAL domain-containing protein [Xanthomonadales bacterium]
MKRPAALQVRIRGRDPGAAARTCLLAALLTLAVPAPAGSQPEPPERLVMAGDANYRPFHFLDATGAAAGFDVELLAAIAAELGTSVDYRLGDWGESLSALADGQVDIVPMFVSEARKRRFAFSQPYLTRYHLVFGRAGGAFVDDLEQLAGRRVAVQHAGLAHEALSALRPRPVLIPLHVESDTVAAVARGEADYAVAPMTIGYEAILGHGLDQVVALSPPVLSLDYAFAVRPDQAALVPAIDQALAQVRAAGVHDRLYLAWLARLGPEPPSFRSGLMLGIALGVPLLLAAILALVWWRRAHRHAERHLRRADSEAVLRRDAEARVHYLAYNDPHTDLPNRNALNLALTQALPSALAAGRTGALARIDLLGLDLVHAVAGHAAIDAMVASVGLALADTGRDATAYSVGRGQFALLLADVGDGHGARARLQEHLERASRRVLIEGVSLEPRFASGVALFPDHGSEASQVLRAAEMACTAALDRGGQVLLYGPRLEPDPINLSVLAELRDALSSGAVGHALQPKLDLASGRVVGAELLVRWHHPVRGPVPPSRFVPLAERTGMVGALTRYMIGRAVEHLQRLRDQRLDISVAVNVSVNDLADDDLVTDLLGQVGDLGNQLVLEVTETDVMRDADIVLASVQRLRQRGIRISLDDFGAGHASFVYLRRMAPDELKIDRSFITELLGSPGDQAIVRSSIQLAHVLGATVTAEGIEDAGTLEWLRQAGCDAAQGYHIARPMAPDAFYASDLLRTAAML